MKGDFSTFHHDPQDNDQAVLFQQGRVTLDADLTASELIDLHWRSQAARDTVGAGVAAVPVADSDGFTVTSAAVSGNNVTLTVRPGRIWADGILAHLRDDSLATTPTAPYLESPPNPPGASVVSIGEGVRDAVILELALEELNAFQDPLRLLEPALGGPDTAERVTTRLGFRLLRLADGEDCTTIASKLVDDPAGKGRLTVSLQPEITDTGDCPVVTGGGYSGMEHNLYRVEVAALKAPEPQFKWSQFNGALVGRGTFDATGVPNRCTIMANRTPIVSSGLTEFYLEALEHDAQLGHWRVVYGALATLNSQHELDLAPTARYGTFPSTAGQVFFRLWNGIAPVSDFASAAKELRDGISLQFDAPAAASYRAGDYWTFPIRAGEISNPDKPLDKQSPQGVVLRRVALAEITWNAAKNTTTHAPSDPPRAGTIEDCRRRFAPLTNLGSCCRLRVGDGVTTFGDFDSLEEAAEHLPAHGGELCLLGGLHHANLTMQGKANIRIHGCPRQTTVIPRQSGSAKPIVHLIDCVGITICDLDLLSFFGPAIVADATTGGDLGELEISGCRLTARTFAVHIDHARDVTIARNHIRMLDTTLGRSAIELRATSAIIERNEITVWPLETWDGLVPIGGKVGNPASECADEQDVYGAQLAHIVMLIASSWKEGVSAPPERPYRALGGIHLLGGCDGVRILDNHIDGGAGHGIALGGLLPGDSLLAAPAPDLSANQVKVHGGEDGASVYARDSTGKPIDGLTLRIVDQKTNVVLDHEATDDNGYAFLEASPGSYNLAPDPGYSIYSVDPTQLPNYFVYVKQVPVVVHEERGFLYEIAIERNEIERMALSGIGFLTFVDLKGVAPVPGSGNLGPFGVVVALLAPRELVTTCNVVQDLVIRENRIHDNLQVEFTNTLRDASQIVGQGGISLGLVETALIAANHVHDNGRSAADGVCGIFVGHGEDVEIDANHVAANGPVLEGYEEKRSQGIRGGIVVRLASAFLVGETAGGRQKPALRIANNRIDQPAGRAITAFAFGPASCVSNYLNSERTGRLGLLDAVVGGVLLVDVGGFQLRGDPRMIVRFQVEKPAPGPLLPGGELLFDGNQVRLGRDHDAAIGMLLASADDLGCEGNQSTVMAQGGLFANAVCMAPTVRVVGNRLREYADPCYFSMLSVGVGFAAGDAVPMNSSSLNQGDHCIVATHSGKGGAAALIVDAHNLERGSSADPAIPCSQLKLPNSDFVKPYILKGMFATFDFGKTTPSDVALLGAEQAAVDAVGQAVRGVVAGLSTATSIEFVRVVMAYPAGNQRTIAAQSRFARSSATIGLLKVEAQMLAISEVHPGEGEAVVDGHIGDGKRGLADYTVELLGRGATPVADATTSEDTGYFAIALAADQVERLAGQPLTVRATDPTGTVVFRSALPGKIVPGATTRVPIVITGAHAAPAGAQPGGPAPTTSTPLETIRGVGPKTADRLRAAGIADIEALARTPGEKLVELAGKDARVLKRHLEQASAEANADNPIGDSEHPPE